ncbi:hypothetical protein BDF21DRAFT_401795 [Thamnidium elegans]|nr:hypothetical protein BDF21DRAFT_401795 [Thamnidium elegans]
MEHTYASHSIVHFPLSHSQPVYHLFQKAHSLGYPVPGLLYLDELKTSLKYTLSSKDPNPFGKNKSQLWESFFNLDYVQKKKRKKDTPTKKFKDCKPGRVFLVFALCDFYALRVKIIVYCLKVCKTCLDGEKIWHIDINAIVNIRGIMMAVGF